MTARQPEILALIPARGGSKGIPRKNLIRIGGQPLIAYSIAQARASVNITRVIVSTDDDEIASVARAHGAEVPFMRPAALAQDASTDLDVFVHVLATLREREGYSCEGVVHLRPTGPVRRVERIDEAIQVWLRHPEADSLRSVVSPDQSPFKMWRIDRGWLEPVAFVDGVPDAHSRPRQSLPEVFWQNGYVDIVRARTVLEDHSMTGRRILPFVMDEAVLELDDPEDIAAVEAALRNVEAPAPRPRRHPS